MWDLKIELGDFTDFISIVFWGAVIIWGIWSIFDENRKK